MRLLTQSGNTGPAVLIFALAFVFLAVAMGHGVNFYDEGIILEGAARVSAGAVVHRDFYANYGPGQFYVIAGLFKMFGTSVLVERAWDTSIRAGVVALAFCIVRQVGRPLDGVFAAALTAVWLGAVGTYGYPVFPAEFFTLLAVLLMTPLFADRRLVSSLLGCGICIGVTVLFRYDVGFYAFVGLNGAATAHVLTRKPSVGAPFRELLRVLSPIWLGTAAVCVPVAAAYVVSGAMPDFIFDIVTYPTHYYARMRSLPFPGSADLISAPDKFAVYLPIPIALAAVATLALAKAPEMDSDARPATARRSLVLLLTLLCGLFFLKGWVRVSVEHMVLSIICALILAVALLVYARSAIPRHGAMPLMIASALALIVAVVPTIAVAKIVAANVANGLAWALRPATWAATRHAPEFASCRPPPGLERVACFAIDTNRANAALYIHGRSQPTDTVFIGVVGYDRIVVNDVLTYFVMGMKPATKWYHFDPGLQTTAEIQRKVIQELAAQKPRFVMTETHLDDFPEPNESSVSSGVNLLDDYILANYRPIHTFGNIVVMQSLVP